MLPNHNTLRPAADMPADPIDLKPFPPLPLELKGEILSHCDASTLANASSVSLAFLQLASPVLYNHVTFVGPEGHTKFLTLRVSAPSLFLCRHSLVIISVS